MTILKTSENMDKFWPAFIQAKGDMGQPELNCRNPHFRSKYADLTSLFKCVREPFKANGLNFIQTLGHKDGNGALETRIIHVSGQWIAGEWVFGIDSNIQKLGAQFTYLKRYHLYSILGLAGEEDTDGQVNRNGSAEAINQPPTAKTVTSAQLTRMFAMISEREITTQDVKYYMKTTFNLDSSKDMNMNQYAKLCLWIQEQPEKEHKQEAEQA